MRSWWLSSILLGVVVASSASAGVLGPSKASGIVFADAFITPCLTPGHLAFDGTATATGSNALFVIPPKKAFVATALIAKISGLSAGEIASMFVNIENANGGASNPLIETYAAPANAAGVGVVSLTLPTGAAFSPPAGSKICVGVDSGTVQNATMYGYFAPAK
jgi:hypothetical protein